MKITTSTSLALALLAGGAALAQEGTPIAPDAVDPANRMSIAVTAAVHERVKDLIDPQKTIRLVLVAHQAAIAETCEGYEMDVEKFTTAMNDIVGDLWDLTEEGQNNLAVDAVMFAYGMAVGGEAAVAAFDTETYCADAADFRESLAADTDGSFTILASGG